MIHSASLLANWMPLKQELESKYGPEAGPCTQTAQDAAQGPGIARRLQLVFQACYSSALSRMQVLSPW